MTVVTVVVDTGPSSGIVDASHHSADCSPRCPHTPLLQTGWGQRPSRKSRQEPALPFDHSAFALIQIVLLGAISMKIGFVPRPSGKLFRHQLKLRDSLDNEKIK